MDVESIIKLAAQGGISLVVVGAFIWLVRTVGIALVAEIRGQRQDMAEHHNVEVEHHTLVREDLSELRGHLGMPPRERTAPVRRQTQPGLVVVHDPEGGK